jgi:hypothetical protein
MAMKMKIVVFWYVAPRGFIINPHGATFQKAACFGIRVIIDLGLPILFRN